MYDLNNSPPKHDIRYYDQWVDSLFIMTFILVAVIVLLISIFVNLRC